MSRDKQIEEMAKIINGYCEAECLDGCYNCVPYKNAEQLYNAGYRKASDVVRVIFEEIEKSIANLEYKAKTPRKTVKVEELKAQVNWVLHEVVPNTIAEVKKKYESECKP